ncbi:MAG: apolipoprotein N-acyltransferase, partial [Actinomycetota bacterium]
VAAVGAPPIFGAVTRDAAGSEHTAVLALDGTGGLVDRYEKVHLVPFGEYVPWRERLGWVEEIALIPVDRVPGERPRVLRVDGLPAFGAPICFENSFPEIGREMVRDGARFLVLTINNASYGMSAASSEHLVMSRVLAMETGRWVVHAAISGITAVIDPRGSVVATRGLFDPGITRATIAASARVTPAVRLGDGAALLAAAFVLSAALRTPARRRAGAVPRPLESARTLVVLPTYQEALSIDEVLARLLALPDEVDILVVDDGSPDGTADVVRRRMAGEPRVRLRERPGKAGLASAYLLGFRVGLEEGYDLVVEMDSDLSHRPEDLPRILAAARAGQDLAIGSRYVPGGGVSNWSRARLALSRTGNLYARWSLGVPVQDATSGFRAYRSDLLAELVATPLRTDGYGFQIELVDRSVDLGATIGEVPITFAERAAGASKMSRRIVAEALWNITRWGVARRLRRHVPAGTERP